MLGLYFSWLSDRACFVIIECSSTAATLGLLKMVLVLPSATLGHVRRSGVRVVGGLVVPVGGVPLRLPAVVEATLVGTGGSAVAGGSCVSPSSAAAGAAAL